MRLDFGVSLYPVTAWSGSVQLDALIKAASDVQMRAAVNLMISLICFLFGHFHQLNGLMNHYPILFISTYTETLRSGSLRIPLVE